MMGRELSLPEAHGHSMSCDSSDSSSPWGRPVGTTWFGLGCGQDVDDDPGHHLGWGTLGHLSCSGTQVQRRAGPFSQVRGEDLSQKSSAGASSYNRTTDLQHSLICQGLLFILSTKDFAKGKTEEVEENPRVLVAHPPPVAAFVHDSKLSHQTIPPLSYLHVFCFLHPSWSCI